MIDRASPRRADQRPSARSRKSPARDARRRGARRAFKCGEARERRSFRLLQPKKQFDINAEAFLRAKEPRIAIASPSASTKMRRLSSVNIPAICGCPVRRDAPATTMRTMIKIDYAVQCQNSDFDDWDTIRTSITPHEARARRLMRWQRACARSFTFGSSNVRPRRRSYRSKRTDVAINGRPLARLSPFASVLIRKRSLHRQQLTLSSAEIESSISDRAAEGPNP